VAKNLLERQHGCSLLEGGKINAKNAPGPEPLSRACGNPATADDPGGR
jgi:hypothetical protein